MAIPSLILGWGGCLARSIESIVRAADLTATFALALQGGLVAWTAGLDPVGVLVIAFVTALGGGVIRDVLLGAHPVAAISGWTYSAVVLSACALTGLLSIFSLRPPEAPLTVIDAVGLALAVIAGTEKALAFGINRLTATFVGTVGSVGGGLLRDVVLNRVPAVLRTDVYATAAFAAAVFIVLGARLGLPPRVTAIGAGLICFGLRVAAMTYHWSLPHAVGSPFAS